MPLLAHPAKSIITNINKKRLVSIILLSIHLIFGYNQFHTPEAERQAVPAVDFRSPSKSKRISKFLQG